MSTTKENKAEIDELREMCGRLANECAELRVKLGDHEARIETMEVAKPPELRRLTIDAVAAAIAQDPYARFEVLKDWRHGHHEITGGSVIRADHFPFLQDYVKAGLMLGVPSDQGAVIARMRKEAEARANAALAETRLAEASASRAATQAAEARAAAATIEQAPPNDGVEEADDLAF